MAEVKRRQKRRELEPDFSVLVEMFGLRKVIETLGPELIELRRVTPFSQLRGYVKVQKRAVNRSLHFAADLWPGRPPLC